MEDICRAITFINYHIPQIPGAFERMEYCTVGFFDGMATERLKLDYKDNSLKALWYYNLRCTVSGSGQYSYQNVFCIGCDDWNLYEDEVFWSDETNAQYPLTFVAFLQLRNYMAGSKSCEGMCRCFSTKVYDCLESQGMVYSYGTVDKNDIVVCMKCRNYERAVDAIKQLHGVEEIVYSYTIFSVSNKILTLLPKGSYRDIYDEKIPSICLKGIANTYDPTHRIPLDVRYHEFCEKLVTALYGDEEKEKIDYKIYDILGDDDFRLIARNVSLGKLLEQFASGGALCYEEKIFRFYLFSSSLVLNTRTSTVGIIDKDDVQRNIASMNCEFSTPICDCLQKKMSGILNIVKSADSPFGEKTITFCHAMWQLLRSLKALEAAPTKKYDFFSLYHPFSLLVDIIAEKIEAYNTLPDKIDDISLFENNREIYDFIHKISMTLHGTLRTDIQFFQIRDFNVIVHYAPAKLRAFYAIWTLELTDYYNDFCDTKNSYSFIFAPGMFRDICVKELFTEYAATKRLMLITLPERDLYCPDRLLIVLAHEVSHYVGYKVRNRPLRHRMLEKGCCRIIELELRHLEFILTDKGFVKEVEEWIRKDLSFGNIIDQQIERINATKEKEEEEELGYHLYHSRNSLDRILRTFRDFGRYYLEKIVKDESESLNQYLRNEAERQGLFDTLQNKINCGREILKQCDLYQSQMIPLFHKFQSTALNSVLEILRSIMTEACADLNAVLTLDLTPKEYIFSFVKDNDQARTGWKGNNQITVRSVRCGLVIKTVETLVKGHRESFLTWKASFVQSWNCDVLRDLAANSDVNTVEGNLSISIYDYVSRLRRCSDNISSYRSIYDDRLNVRTFSNTEYDFLNDLAVWDILKTYLERCSEDYLNEMKGNMSDEIIKRKSRFVETYREVKEGSTLGIMRNVEMFLQQYEERHLC